MNDDLNRLIAAYQGMDEAGKRFILDLAELKAKKYPARNVPGLQVVYDNVDVVAGNARKAVASACDEQCRHGQRSSAVYPRVPPALRVVK